MSNPGTNKPDMPNLLRKFAASLEKRLRKSGESLILETMNPLWQIDMARAQTIYDWARRGNFAQLQFLYNEIENSDATFLTCVTRRCSAISELDWRVVRSNEHLNRKADEGLVKEQIDFLETAIAKIDNLPEAMEHLALSAFRGFSVLNTHYGFDEMPTHLECLDHWNICFDRHNRRWLWNPTAASYADPTNSDGTLTEMPAEDIIVVARKRQIDWPALMIFLRAAIGERDWGRFLETYGLPPVIITMPDLTNEKDVNKFLKAAENVFEGRSGVVPAGSEVNYASESRGVNPFTEFIEHQMKEFVLLATGGTLTSLAESGSGTLAGNAQMEVWKQIVRADTRIISNRFNKQLAEGLIKKRRDFKGRPILAEFQLDTTPKMTPDEVAELAGKFSSAGYEMDEKELSQMSGFTIRKKQESVGGIGFNADKPDKPNPPDGGAPIVVNSGEDAPHPTQKPAGGVPPPKPAPTAAEAKNASQGGSDTNGGAQGKGEPAAELAASLQDDFKAVADRINAILNLPAEKRADAATKLMAELDSLVSDDPMMAEVIAEQMAEAFGGQVAKGPAAKVSNAAPVDTHGAQGEPWTGFDLDGTLAKYDGWKGVDNIGDPQGEVFDLIKRLHAEGKRVKIFTARVSPADGEVKAAEARAYIEEWCERFLGFVPEITHEKDQLMETLYDDRVHKVDAKTGTIMNGGAD